MKHLVIAFFLLCSMQALQAQSPYTADVVSEDAILKALYDVISGPAGQARDWDRFRYLFTADARLIPTQTAADGSVSYKSWTPQEYVDMFTASRSNQGFFERELNRIIEYHGTVAHVFSTYELREDPKGPVFRRGINSIQLLKTHDRWYVMNVLWSNESDQYPIPNQYLEK